MADATTAGDLIDLHDIGTDDAPKPKVLIQTEPFNVLRLIIAAGKTVPEHHAAKEITVQCVVGKLEFNTMGKTLVMTPGKMLFLPPGERHSLHAIEDSVVLVTKAN